MTDAILHRAFAALPASTRAIIKAFASAIKRYGINTKRKLAASLGQLYHETAGFSAKVKNLNYSFAGLREVLPR